MEIKSLIVKNDDKYFENKIKEYLEKGYKVQSSNITIVPRQANSIIQIVEPDFYHYALLIKE